MKKLSPELQRMFEHAKKARENSYSPYSGHKVGASLVTADGEIFSGCNVENASYGATVCAERAAIQNAISQRGKIEIKEILVLTDENPAWPPCGMCRQVISEFVFQTAIVHICNLSGETKTLPFAELLPNAFSFPKDG
ncbi:MAG: cytidine deaminase [Deltaproteobacteria bacterium]|nr:cytidine deaminase [Deltaproteobacteria bacterium]